WKWETKNVQTRLSLRWLMASFCGAVCALPIAHGDDPKATSIEFNRDIRPIFADNCYACHGPDKNQRKADLRLDMKENAVADRGGYQAIVPGLSDQSELLRRITSTDSEVRMPPSRFGKQLTARQIDRIRRWIEQGARWQDHWSRLTPKRPAVPPAPATM